MTAAPSSSSFCERLPVDGDDDGRAVGDERAAGLVEDEPAHGRLDDLAHGVVGGGGPVRRARS